jgi:hypothetical protein
VHPDFGCLSSNALGSDSSIGISIPVFQMKELDFCNMMAKWSSLLLINLVTSEENVDSQQINGIVMAEREIKHYP